MKKLLYFTLAVMTALGLAACGVSAVSEPPTDEASAPDGLSGYPFELSDTTYVLWRAIRSTGTDGSAVYEIQMLQKGQRMPIKFAMGTDGKMHPNSSIGMKLVMPDGSKLDSGEVSFFATEEVAGYNAVSCYSFTLSSGQRLPDKAVFFSSDADAEIELDLSSLILVDAERESEQAAVTEPSPSPEASENTVPEALIGTWEGTGEPAGGGTPLSLKVVINVDGTGNYVFEQAGYSESYPTTLTSAAEHFSVDIPSDNALGISKSGGTYSYEDGILTLNITTDFTSGRQ